MQTQKEKDLEAWFKILEALARLHGVNNSSKGSIGLAEDTDRVLAHIKQKGLL